MEKVFGNRGAKGEANGMYRHDLDNEVIAKMYNEDNMSLHLIAEHFNVAHSTISNRLRDMGIEIVRKPRRDKAKDNTPAKNKLFYKYRMQAKRRDIEFNLPVGVFLKLIAEDCHYCGESPSNKEVTSSGHVLYYNGIDRVKNDKGYVLDNVVSCCSICNKMKSDLDFDVFMDKIQRISRGG